MNKYPPSKPQSSQTKCFECETWFDKTLPICPNCQARNEHSRSVTVDLCQFELDSDHCPLPAAIDRRWCRHHADPGTRAHTDANRRFFEQILQRPRDFLPNGSMSRTNSVVEQRIKPEWYRAEGESRDGYHARMMQICAPMMRSLGIARSDAAPIDRKAVQQAAAAARIKSIRLNDVDDVVDDFEAAVDVLMDDGLTPEAAAGMALQQVLKERLS